MKLLLFLSNTPRNLTGMEIKLQSSLGKEKENCHLHPLAALPMGRLSPGSTAQPNKWAPKTTWTAAQIKIPTSNLTHEISIRYYVCFMINGSHVENQKFFVINQYV